MRVSGGLATVAVNVAQAGGSTHNEASNSSRIVIVDNHHDQCSMNTFGLKRGECTRRADSNL